VARRARDVLAQNLQAVAGGADTKMRFGAVRARLRRGLDPSNFLGSKAWVVTSIFIQVVLVFIMWRFAHAEARRLFYSTYYDPFYPELDTLTPRRPYPFPESSILNAYEVVRREGLAEACRVLVRTFKQLGNDAWQRWGEQPYTGVWPPS